MIGDKPWSRRRVAFLYWFYQASAQRLAANHHLAGRAGFLYCSSTWETESRTEDQIMTGVWYTAAQNLLPFDTRTRSYHKKLGLLARPECNPKAGFYCIFLPCRRLNLDPQVQLQPKNLNDVWNLTCLPAFKNQLEPFSILTRHFLLASKRQ